MTLREVDSTRLTANNDNNNTVIIIIIIIITPLRKLQHVNPTHSQDLTVTPNLNSTVKKVLFIFSYTVTELIFSCVCIDRQIDR